MSRALLQPSLHVRELINLIGKRVHVVIDRRLGSRHPKHSGIAYKTNYGFIPGTLAPDGEEIDAYVIGVSHPLSKFDGTCIAIIHRLNDLEGKAVIARSGQRFSDRQIQLATNFQESHFESRILRKGRLK